jgi:hypothetical protein
MLLVELVSLTRARTRCALVHLFATLAGAQWYATVACGIIILDTILISTYERVVWWSKTLDKFTRAILLSLIIEVTLYI